MTQIHRAPLWKILEQINAAITAGSLTDGDKGDITVSGVGTIWTIDPDVVTYAKIQNVSATDRILGRSTAGAGDIEEIVCTAAARSLLDDATVAAMLTTLGGQPLDATLTALAGADWAANALPIGTGVDTLAQTVFAANTFPARSSVGNLVAKSITDFGLSLVDDADATAGRVTLGVVIGTNVQAYDAMLTALAAEGATTGLLACLGGDTVAPRTITGTVNQIAVSRGDGGAGNPVLSIPADLILPSGTTGTTQAPGTNNTTIATTAFVAAAGGSTPDNHLVSVNTTLAAGGYKSFVRYREVAAGITYEVGADADLERT